MIKKTLWRPDTCECVLEYQWDDQDPIEARAHVASRIIVSCPIHQGLPLTEHLDAVTKDNVRKNKTEQILVELLPALTEKVLDSEKREVSQLKEPLKHRYAPDGVLEITLPPEVLGKKGVEDEIHSRLKEAGKIRIL